MQGSFCIKGYSRVTESPLDSHRGRGAGRGRLWLGREGDKRRQAGDLHSLRSN